MNGLLNLCRSAAQSLSCFGNANGPAEDEAPEVPGTTESTTSYLSDTGAPPEDALLLQAKSLGARYVQRKIELSADKFIELLQTDDALPNDILFVIDDDLFLCETDRHLTDFTGNLYVRGTLTLYDCSVLSDLSGNIIVGSDFECSGCRELTDISGNITVENDIEVRYCRKLENLSGNISNKGCLRLIVCSRLRSLSGTISPGSNLFFWRCPQLTALPDWITSLGPTLSGRTREVLLSCLGLSDALIDRLRSAEAPGMSFYIPGDVAQPTQPFDNFQMAFAFWRELAASDAETPALTLLPYQSCDLVIFLEKLTTTADYNNLASRPVLAQRIIHTLLSVLGNEQIQDQALALIHDAISSCGDRVILALDDLETLELQDSAKTMAIKHESPSELRALGLKMKRMSEVKLIARKHADKHPWTDEVEVALAYQIEIRKHLELPGATKHMLYRPCAQVSQQDIDEALVQLNSNCGEEQLQEFLKVWEPWQFYQRRLSTPPFDQLPQQMVNQIQQCSIGGDITDQMVMLNDTHMTYEALCKTYQLTGNNPLTNTPLDWSAVVRLTEVLGDNSSMAKISPKKITTG